MGENGVACKSVKVNLSYTIPYLQCGRYDGNDQYLQHNCQDFTQTCLRNQAATTSLELPAPMTAPAVLGRPYEWFNPNFKLFDTCAGSGATAHTMAEMTIDFTNSC